ncbi:MAG: helix-turn-helix transcriptional regulator [Erysipelotrichaceae bacterium]|nr:helix-turn-helix transcriptional regulator [Erysipelotrichaceae bacterium]MBR2546402.1 helix-turn-helix transcriptional regulator [Erysipelotrichaceae bacterium]
MRKTTKTSLDDIIKEQMNDPEFAEAWAETELEDQIKRNLIQARIDAGLTQKELAEKSGVRQSNISRIENGTAIPTLQTLNAIAKGTGKKLKISFE